MRHTARGMNMYCKRISQLGVHIRSSPGTGLGMSGVWKELSDISHINPWNSFQIDCTLLRVVDILYLEIMWFQFILIATQVKNLSDRERIQKICSPPYRLVCPCHLFSIILTKLKRGSMIINKIIISVPNDLSLKLL